MTSCLHRLSCLQALFLYCTHHLTGEIACAKAYVHESYFLGAALQHACPPSLSTWDSMMTLSVTWIVGTFPEMGAGRLRKNSSSSIHPSLFWPAHQRRSWQYLICHVYRPNRKWEKLWLRCAFDSLLLVVVTAPALPIAQYSDVSVYSILETALIDTTCAWENSLWEITNLGLGGERGWAAGEQIYMTHFSHGEKTAYEIGL